MERVEVYRRAAELRAEGLMYREIGDRLEVTEDVARNMVRARYLNRRCRRCEGEIYPGEGVRYCKACRKPPVRAKKLRLAAIDPLTPQEIEDGKSLDYGDHVRPKTRGECPDTSLEPCPWTGCSLHMYLDVRPNGTLVVNFPGIEPHQMKVSCALDVADSGGASLEQVAAMSNLDKERVRQEESVAIDKIKRYFR